MAGASMFGLRPISGRGGCRDPEGADRVAAVALATFAAYVHAHGRRRPWVARTAASEITG